MMNYIKETGKRYIVITSNADKIAKTKVDDYVKNIQKQLNPSGDITTFPFSSERKIYSDEVWNIIKNAI